MRGLQRPRNLLLLGIAALLTSALLVFGGRFFIAQQQKQQFAELTDHYAGQLRALDAARGKQPVCPEGDRGCLEKTMGDHAVRRMSNWQTALARPLLERIAPAPTPLLEYIGLDNLANGHPNRPRPARVDPAFMADVRAAFESLPSKVLALIQPKLIGIFLVDDLGGTGFSESALDAGGKHAAAFIVLDAGVLHSRVANTWATWKEASPFATQQGWSLEAIIAEDAENNRMRAIQYILLHELGHVVAAGLPVHPWPGLQPRDTGASQQYPFFSLSWRVPAGENRYESLFEAQFPLRSRVTYYFGPRLRASDMPETYRQLEQTNFPTLYAATHPGDDFAESFANYVHSEMLEQPFQILLRQGKAAVRTYGACWSSERCVQKRAILTGLIEGAPDRQSK